MSNCYLIKVPFATKGEINQKENSLKIKGFAYYLYDFESKTIIHEYLELTKANYRLTDKNMIEPTKYYLQKKTRDFRDAKLDSITNHIPKEIIETTFHDLNKNQINEINKYLWKEDTTVRTQFAYFFGSTIAGAKTNNLASQLVCTEQEYFGCNFANPLAEISKKKKNINSYKPSKFEPISLVDFINKNESFMKIFKWFNKWYFNDQPIERPKGVSNTNSKNNVNKSHVPKNLKQKINEYISLYLNGTWEESNKNKHKIMLRTFFNSAVRKQLAESKIPFWSTKLKYNSSIIENAHIISFAKLVEENTEESIRKAINPFNVLRIDANHHKLFDADKITFNLNGHVINQKEILHEFFLDIDVLPKETIHFLKENFEYWNDNKANK